MLQYVSLHECAHIASFKLYKDFTGLATRMNAIHGAGTRIEQLAEPVVAMGATSIHLYTLDCSGYRGTAARALVGRNPPPPGCETLTGIRRPASRPVFRHKKTPPSRPNSPERRGSWGPLSDSNRRPPLYKSGALAN